MHAGQLCNRPAFQFVQRDQGLTFRRKHLHRPLEPSSRRVRVQRIIDCKRDLQLFGQADSPFPPGPTGFAPEGVDDYPKQPRPERLFIAKVAESRQGRDQRVLKEIVASFPVYGQLPAELHSPVVFRLQQFPEPGSGLFHSPLRRFPDRSGYAHLSNFFGVLSKTRPVRPDSSEDFILMIRPGLRGGSRPSIVELESQERIDQPIVILPLVKIMVPKGAIELEPGLFH